MWAQQRMKVVVFLWAVYRVCLVIEFFVAYMEFFSWVSYSIGYLYYSVIFAIFALEHVLHLHPRHILIFLKWPGKKLILSFDAIPFFA